MPKDENGFRSSYSGIDVYYFRVAPRLMSVVRPTSIIVEQGRILGENRVFVKGKVIGYENEQWGNLVIHKPMIIAKLRESLK